MLKSTLTTVYDFLFIVTPMGVCNCSMYCCTLLYVHSSIAIILMGKRELIALLNLSSWCLMMVERLFLAVPQGSLQFVIVVFPDHTHLLFLMERMCVGEGDSRFCICRGFVEDGVFPWTCLSSHFFSASDHPSQHRGLAREQ